MKDVILKLENISYKVVKKDSLYHFDSVEIVKNISFELKRGNVLGVSGESGSGKSTLAKIISGINKEYSGNIETKFLQNWDKMSPEPVQILFQNDGELINPFRRVKDILSEAFAIKNNMNKDYSLEVSEIFTRLGLKRELLESMGSQLSGGEKQRIALARIIIVEPEILVLDEPFSSQDIESQVKVLKLIKQIKKELGLTIICISHDLNILKYFADEIAIMFRGEIVEMGEAKRLIQNPVHEYTKFLLSAQSLNLTSDEIESFHKNYEQN